MADTLETAADELVRKLRAVDGEVEIAHDRFAELKKDVSSLGDQIDAAWTDLAKQVAELVEKAEEETASIQRECDEAGKALAQLEGGARSAQSNAASALQQAESSTAEFGDYVRQKEEPLDRLVTEAAEKTFESLGERADEVASEMERALEEAKDFLADEVTSSLEEMQEQIGDRLSALRDTLVDECGSALQAAYDDWSAKLDEVVDLVEEEGFEATKDNAKEVVAHALEECSKAHETELENLLKVAELVEEALKTVVTDVEERRSELAEAKGDLDGGLEETKQALADALEALDEVKQLLASYTFVSV